MRPGAWIKRAVRGKHDQQRTEEVDRVVEQARAVQDRAKKIRLMTEEQDRRFRGGVGP